MSCSELDAAMRVSLQTSFHALGSQLGKGWSTGWRKKASVFKALCRCRLPILPAPQPILLQQHTLFQTSSTSCRSWGSLHCPSPPPLLRPTTQMAISFRKPFLVSPGSLPPWSTPCVVFGPSLVATTLWLFTSLCAEPLGDNYSLLMFLDQNTENSLLIFGE